MAIHKLNRKQISDEVAFNFYEAAQKLKRETGKSVGDILLEMIYDPETSHLARVQALRVFFEIVSPSLDDEQAMELMELTGIDSLKATH